MGKILHSQTTAKGSTHYIAGIITRIRENTDERHPYTIEMAASVYDASSKKWLLKNIALQSWAANDWNCIDKIKRMNVQVGSAVLCTCGNLSEYEYTDKKGKSHSVLQAPLFNIAYGIKWMLEQDKSNLCLLCGTVDKVHEYKDGGAAITVNISIYDKEKKKGKNVPHECDVNDKTYASLKKADIKKGGTLACVGYLTDDTSMDVKRAEFLERMKQDNKESEKSA